MSTIEALERCEICPKLTINTSDRRQRRRSGVFIVNSERISHLFLVFLLLTFSQYTLAGYFFKLHIKSIAYYFSYWTHSKSGIKYRKVV